MDIDWEVAIDWDDDGVFEDVHTSSSGSLESIAIKGGREGAGDDFAATELRFTLENPEGVYSRFNPSSPIYGDMKPGRAIRVRATHNAVTYTRFLGEFVEAEEGYQGAEVPLVTFSALGAFERLRRGSLRISLQENKRVDELLTVIADAANWPIGRRTFDTARVTLDRFWQYRASPLEALKAAAKQELGGQLYENAAGDLTFENRDHRALEALYATVTDPLLLGLNNRFGDLIDRVKFTRAGLDVEAGLTAVWSLSPGGRRLDPGSSSPLNTIHVEYDVAAKGAVTPVAFTDYNANAQADGLGADKTAQVAIASFTSYGGGATIVFDNQDSAPVYLVGAPAAQIRAQAVRRSNDERAIEVLAASSLVSDQELADDFEFNDDAAAIRSFALWRAATLSEDQPRPRLRLLTSTDAEIAIALGIDVSKLVRVQHTTGLYPSYVDGYFYVEGYSLEQVIGEDLRAEVTLFSADQAIGSFFRISGAAGAGQDYSLIRSAGDTDGDRIAW
ncbi:MAG: hypothetical protein E6Q97_08195 [Desulfurellales bacterium]|nr:MAG: hypothetical protein E6Q97_08195 [Desulfurellales bacterium]